MLHNLKYNFASSISDAFKFLLIKYFEQNKINITSKDSVIVPIPLHKKRLAERGFNQSELIGNHVAEILQLKINPKLLIRTKNTKSQMTLNKADRILNMQKSFVCPDPAQVKGKDIILIDDVLTTGTTIREAAQALKASGCRSVSAIVLAKGGLINMKDNVRID
ncbi:MAG: phosphoribosyltransferase family protein [Patescibacteria group bacterium]